MTVTVSDILDYLVAVTAAPSTFGAQLEKIKYGIESKPDPWRARDETEQHLIEQAGIIRCLDAFQAKREFSMSVKVLEKIQIATHYDQGALAVGIMRAYHERSTQSQERGLLAVYQFLATIAPAVVPLPPKGTEDLLQSFREGSAKRARSISAEAYADSLLALQNHVRHWNKSRCG